MNKSVSRLALGFFGLVVGCTNAVDVPPVATSDDDLTCADPSTLPPRQSMEATPLPSVAAKWDAWKAEFAEYQAAAAAASTEAAAHAEAYESAVRKALAAPGSDCTDDAKCSTGDVDFPGHCRIYYDHGQCEVIDAHPVVGPIAPAQPAVTCADFACIAGFQCEQETSTQGIACVESRNKKGCKPVGGNGNHTRN